MAADSRGQQHSVAPWAWLCCSCAASAAKAMGGVLGGRAVARSAAECRTDCLRVLFWGTEPTEPGQLTSSSCAVAALPGLVFLRDSESFLSKPMMRYASKRRYGITSCSSLASLGPGRGPGTQSCLLISGSYQPVNTRLSRVWRDPKTPLLTSHKQKSTYSILHSLRSITTMVLSNINMQHISCVLRSPRLARLDRRACTIRATAAPSNQPQTHLTCLITGANTGIGFETALATCRAGYATVLACRDKAKAEAAKAAIKYAMLGCLINIPRALCCIPRAQVPGAKVEVALLDLANLSTVRDFANKALDVGKPLDILINNAGMLKDTVILIVKHAEICARCRRHGAAQPH